MGSILSPNGPSDNPGTIHGEATFPLWAPDGQHVVFQWLKDGRYSLAMQAANATASPHVLIRDAPVPSSFRRDWRLAAVPRGGGDVAMVTAENGTAVEQAWLRTAHEKEHPVFSPDGRWLAFQSDASGRAEVWVQPYPGPGTAEMVFSREGGYSPFWHPSGRELLFIADDPRPATFLMMAADFTPGTSRRIGTPQLLFEFNPRLLTLLHTPVAAFDLTEDGQSFYAVQHSTPPPHRVVTHINLIQNWFEELKAKVPAR